MRIRILRVCDCFKITDPSTGEIIGKLEKMPNEFYEEPSQPMMMLYQKDSCGDQAGFLEAIIRFSIQASVPLEINYDEEPISHGSKPKANQDEG